MASPPFPSMINQDPLFKARGDISAGEIKIFKDIVSLEGRVDLLLSQKEAEEVFNLSEDDRIEIGPFVVRYAYSCLHTILGLAGFSASSFTTSSSNLPYH